MAPDQEVTEDTDDEDSEIVDWVRPVDIQPQYAYMVPDGHEKIEFRRYEYGFLDVVVLDEDDDRVQKLTFEYPTAQKLAEVLERVVDNEHEYHFTVGDFELAVDEKLWVSRYVRSYNPNVPDAPYPANVHDADEHFDPTRDEIDVPRDVAEPLLMFIQQTVDIYEYSHHEFEDRYDEDIQLP